MCLAIADGIPGKPQYLAEDAPAISVTMAGGGIEKIDCGVEGFIRKRRGLLAAVSGYTATDA